MPASAAAILAAETAGVLDGCVPLGNPSAFNHQLSESIPLLYVPSGQLGGENTVGTAESPFWMQRKPLLVNLGKRAVFGSGGPSLGAASRHSAEPRRSQRLAHKAGPCYCWPCARLIKKTGMWCCSRMLALPLSPKMDHSEFSSLSCNLSLFWKPRFRIGPFCL